jgi:hypothetical protein
MLAPLAVANTWAAASGDPRVRRLTATARRWAEVLTTCARNDLEQMRGADASFAGAHAGAEGA